MQNPEEMAKALEPVMKVKECGEKRDGSGNIAYAQEALTGKQRKFASAAYARAYWKEKTETRSTLTSGSGNETRRRKMLDAALICLATAVYFESRGEPFRRTVRRSPRCVEPGGRHPVPQRHLLRR